MCVLDYNCSEYFVKASTLFFHFRQSSEVMNSQMSLSGSSSSLSYGISSYDVPRNNFQVNYSIFFYFARPLLKDSLTIPSPNKEVKQTPYDVAQMIKKRLFSKQNSRLPEFENLLCKTKSHCPPTALSWCGHVQTTHVTSNKHFSITRGSSANSWTTL